MTAKDALVAQTDRDAVQAPPAAPHAAVAQPESQRAPNDTEPAGMPTLLEELEVTPAQQGRRVVTAQGRSIEVMNADDGGDERISIRAPHGKLLLEIRFTDAGAVLELEQAELELTATKRLSLRSEEIIIDAAAKLSLRSGGPMRTEVHGDSASHVTGQERREAADMQLQSTAGAIDVRARDAIELDGSSVGLNDRTTREMFDWAELDPEAGPAPTHSEGDDQA